MQQKHPLNLVVHNLYELYGSGISRLLYDFNQLGWTFCNDFCYFGRSFCRGEHFVANFDMLGGHCQGGYFVTIFVNFGRTLCDDFFHFGRTFRGGGHFVTIFFIFGGHFVTADIS